MRFDAHLSPGDFAARPPPGAEFMKFPYFFPRGPPFIGPVSQNFRGKWSLDKIKTFRIFLGKY